MRVGCPTQRSRPVAPRRRLLAQVEESRFPSLTNSALGFSVAALQLRLQLADSLLGSESQIALTLGRFAFTLGRFPFVLRGRREQLAAFEAGQAKLVAHHDPDARKTVARRLEPIELPLHQISIDPIPDPKRRRLCLWVEANQLANAETSVASEFVVPIPVALVARAEDLDCDLIVRFV